jgi:hypothetical protein
VEALQLWDLHRGRSLGDFGGYRGGVLALAFSPDGRQLVSGGAAETALLWDMARLVPAAPNRVVLKAEQVEALGKTLASTDAAKAFQALQTLRDAPAEAVAWVKAHVPPAAAVPAERIRGLIADLDDQRFAVRQKAAQELENLGEAAEPALRRVLEGQPTLALRRQVEQLLDRAATTAPPQILQALRAVELLEWVDTAEARQVLEALARGVDGAPLTRAAKATLKRQREAAGRR